MIKSLREISAQALFVFRGGPPAYLFSLSIANDVLIT